MAAQTVLAQASLVRGAISLKQRSARTFVGTPVAQKTLVTKRAPRFVVRAEAEQNVDVDEVLKDLQDKWEKVDNKPAAIIYGVAAFSAIWLAGTVVNALNGVPLLPKLFELVGLGYSAWFAYRYLLFKSSREELVQDIESLKKKISGDN